MQLKYIALTLIILLFSSCGTTKDVEVLPEEQVQIQEEETPKIVFLYFDIEKNGDEKPKITLTETQVVPGTIKENSIIQEPSLANNLLIRLIDDKDIIQRELVLKNPFIQVIEQYGADGDLVTQNTQVDKSQFYIRFNRNKNIRSIKILNIQPTGDIEWHQEKITI